jgi:hypothetical protein
MKDKYGIKSKLRATKASSGLMGVAAFILVAGLGLLTAGLVPAAAGAVAGLAIVNAMAPGGGAILCAVLGGLAAYGVAEKYITPPVAIAALGLGIVAATVARLAVGGVVGTIELGARSVAAGVKKLFGIDKNKASKKPAADKVTVLPHAEPRNFRATTTATTSFTAATTARATDADQPPPVEKLYRNGTKLEGLPRRKLNHL